MVRNRPSCYNESGFGRLLIGIALPHTRRSRFKSCRPPFQSNSYLAKQVQSTFFRAVEFLGLSVWLGAIFS